MSNRFNLTGRNEYGMRMITSGENIQQTEALSICQFWQRTFICTVENGSRGNHTTAFCYGNVENARRACTKEYLAFAHRKQRIAKRFGRDAAATVHIICDVWKAP